MRIINVIALFFCFFSINAQPFEPAAGQDGTTAVPHNSSEIKAWATSCSIVRGFVNIADTTAQHNDSNRATYGKDSVAIGIADNNVVSLGDAGVATLTFDMPITNGEGYDFAVFENSFSDEFLELAFVEVSSDGENFVRFPTVSSTQTQTQVNGMGSLQAVNIYNFAGKYKGMFGTPFDLEELKDSSRININNITHVRIIDVVGCIDEQFASFDAKGNIVNDPWPTPFYSSGFDLDAVAVINTITTDMQQLTKSDFIVFPNPFKDFININNEGYEELNFEIINSCGVSIFSGNNSFIDTRDFEPGLYFLKIKSEKGLIIKKVLKI